ncbi:MAG: tryptophan synthase subunit alpha, partial [Myxococcales bacterium]|nr:tryptophan synthase subunit alpha [Myxococcales bacterium]
MSQRLSRVRRRRSSAAASTEVSLRVGDPDVEASLVVARALLAAGADVLELGAPFSDPTADGPVIARASARAIAAGGSMRAAIAVGARLRAESDAPLVLFGYCNPIVVRGERATVEAVADAGIDAMLVVDMPPEEGAELRAEARARGVDVIPLLTPTSSTSRIAAAKASASGFVYYVSVTGVTGATTVDPFARDAACMLRLALEIRPVVVGSASTMPMAPAAPRCGRLTVRWWAPPSSARSRSAGRTSQGPPRPPPTSCA